MELKKVIDKFYSDIDIHEGKQLSKMALGERLTNNSMLYLDIIVEKEDCTVSYIAEKLGIAMPAVTVKVKELEKMGFLIKEQSEIDKRTFFLRPTGVVVDIYQKYDETYNNAIDEFIKTHSEEDVKKLAELLNEFTEIYNAKARR